MESGGDVKIAAPPAAKEPEPNKNETMISSSGQDPPAAEPPNREEDGDAESRTVRIGNVDSLCTPEEVLVHFRYCGTVDKVTVKRGYAYVEFVEEAAVRRALLLDQSVLHGRRLNVTAGKTTAESHRRPRGPHSNRPHPVPPRGPVPVLVPVDLYSPYDRGWATAFVPQYFYPPSEQFTREYEFRGVHDRQPDPASEFSLSGDCIPEAERLQREAEKKRIKEEIISAGLARRRALETEALRELQMEGFDFPGSEPIGPSVPSLAIDHNPQPEQLLGRSEEEHSQVPESNKEELIEPENPDRGHCGVKRKVESLSEVPSLPCGGVKKPKEEWSCALCHVSSGCEKDLNSHFQGSKHKAKEATLIAELATLKAEVAAKGCNIPLVAKNSPNLSKLSSTAAGSELNAESKVTTPPVIPSDIRTNAQIKVNEQVILVHKAEEAALKAELPAKDCSTPLVANNPSNLSILNSTSAGSDFIMENNVITAISASGIGAGAKMKVKKQVISVHKSKEAAVKAKPAAKGCSTPLLANKPSNLSELSSAAASSELNAKSKFTTPAVIPSDFCADAKINVKEQVIPVHNAEEAALKAELPAKGCSTMLVANNPSNLSKLSSTAAGSELNAESKVTTTISASDFGTGAKKKVKKKIILVRKIKGGTLKAKPTATGCSTPLLANKPSNLSKLSSATAGSELNTEGEVTTPAVMPSDFVADAKIKGKAHAIPVHKAKNASPKAELAAGGCSTPLMENIPSSMSKLSSTAAGSKLNAESKVSTPEIIASDFAAYAKMKVGTQAQPVPGHCGVKRKVESLSKVPSRPCPGVKKPKEEWSCALCHASFVCEKAGYEHLQCGKHKAKETALKAEVAAKSCGTTLVANCPANLIKLRSAAAGSELNADIKITTPVISASDFGAEVKMKGEAQGISVHKAKEAALRPDLAAKGSSITLVANSTTNLAKLGSAAAGSEVNADSKVKTPANSAIDSCANAKKKVETQVGSKTEVSLSQSSTCSKKKRRAMMMAERSTPGFQWERKFKYWCEMCKIGACVPEAMDAHLKGKKHLKVIHQYNQRHKFVAAIRMLGLSADGKKGDGITIRKADGSMAQDIKTEGVQYVPVNGIENAALNVIAAEVVAKPEHSKTVQEADAKIFQLLSGNIGKKDDIAILKADDSMVLDVKADGVHGVTEKKEVESAASNAIAAGVVAKPEQSKVVRETDAKIFQLLSGSIGKNDDIAILKADGSMVLDVKAEGVHDVPGKEEVESAASNAIAAEVVAKAEHSKVVQEADGKTVRLVPGSIGKKGVAIVKANGSMAQDPKTEGRIHDVPGKEKIESAASNATTAEVVAKAEHPNVVREADGKIARLVSEAHAELLQLLSVSIGKQDHIATGKADGSMVQDVPENEKAESAAANPIDAEDVAEAGHSEVAKEAEADADVNMFQKASEKKV